MCLRIGIENKNRATLGTNPYLVQIVIPHAAVIHELQILYLWIERLCIQIWFIALDIAAL